MSLQTAEPQLLGSGFAPLPRVNLLPPEIAERRRFRQIQYGLGGGLLAALVIVILLYVAALSSVSSANSELTAANDRGTQLTAQTAQYRNVTAIYDQAAAAKAMLTSAMADEVRFSHLLNDLALSVPDTVWITSLGFSEGAVVASPIAPVGGVGTMNVTAVGFSHDDVAVWLDSLAAQPSFVNPDFGTSSESLLGLRKIVTFSSSATLTDKVLSHRYTTAVGG